MDFYKKSPTKDCEAIHQKSKGPVKENLKQKIATSSFQLDLFTWSDKKELVQKKKIKITKCLDCGKVDMKLKFNEQKKIFEGRRLCKLCRQLQKRKYLGGW